MSYTLTADLRSLILVVDWPLEDDGVTPRDDVIGMKVWLSTTDGFTPSDVNLAYDGADLKNRFDGLTAETVYYLKYAIISEIDPTDYVISAQISGTPIRITTVNQDTYIESLTADSIKAGMVRGRALATKGSYLSASCAAGDAVVSVKDTTDFPASGKAYIIDHTVSDYLDEITYTGKTSGTLTGCSGVLAHAADLTIVPAVKCAVVDTSSNEVMVFDAWAGGIKCVARMGGDGYSRASFGIANPSNTSDGVRGFSGSGVGVSGIALDSGKGVKGDGASFGVGVYAAANDGGGVPLLIQPMTSYPSNSLTDGALLPLGGYLHYYNGSGWNTLQTRGAHYFSELDAANTDSISFDDTSNTVSFNADGGTANANIAAASITASGDVNVSGNVVGNGSAVSVYPGGDDVYAALWGGSTASANKGCLAVTYGYKYSSTSARGGALIQTANRDTSDTAINQSSYHIRSMDSSSSPGSHLFYADGALALEIDNTKRLKSTSTLAAATASGTALVIEATTGRISRTSSSLRYKRDVEPADKDYLTDVAMRLAQSLIWYRSACEGDRQDWSWWGLPAEVVAKIDKRFVDFGYPLVKRFIPGEKPRQAVIDNFGELVSPAVEGTPDSFELVPDTSQPLQPESIHYDRMVVPLFALCKRQQEQIDDLVVRIRKLEQLTDVKNA